ETAGVGAKADLDTFPDGLGERLRFELYHRVPDRSAPCGAALRDIDANVDGRAPVDAALDHEVHHLLVKPVAVLDGIDAAAQSGLDAFTPKGVSSHFPSQPVRLADHRANF